MLFFIIRRNPTKYPKSYFCRIIRQVTNTACDCGEHILSLLISLTLVPPARHQTAILLAAVDAALRLVVGRSGSIMPACSCTQNDLLKQKHT